MIIGDNSGKYSNLENTKNIYQLNNVIEGGTFPLSDASSLLMRLELAGVDVKKRARDLSELWEKPNQTFVSLFYDGHACFNNLLAGDTAANTVLLDNMREYINDNRKVRLNTITRLQTIMAKKCFQI